MKRFILGALAACAVASFVSAADAATPACKFFKVTAPVLDVSKDAGKPEGYFEVLQSGDVACVTRQENVYGRDWGFVDYKLLEGNTTRPVNGWVALRYVVPHEVATAPAPASATPVAAAPQPEADSKAPEVWLSIRYSDDPAQFEDFLKQYPNHPFAALATARLEMLQSSKPADVPQITKIETPQPPAETVSAPVTQAPLPVATAPAADAPVLKAEKSAPEVWASIRDSKEAAPFEDFLRRFPDHPFTELANARLATLRGSETAATSTVRAIVPEQAPAPIAPSDAPQTASVAPAAALPPADPAQLAAALQDALQRVGCYSQAIDGDWGPGSQGALARFNALAGSNLPVAPPTPFALETVNNWAGGNCVAVAAAPQPAPRPAAPRTVQRKAAPPPESSGGGGGGGLGGLGIILGGRGGGVGIGF